MHSKNQQLCQTKHNVKGNTAACVTVTEELLLFHPSHQNNFFNIYLPCVERETYGALHNHKHKQVAT